MMFKTTTKKEEFLSLFSEYNYNLLDDNLKDSINNIIQNIDFPSSKVENWKNTSLEGILKHRFSLEDKKDIPDEFVDTFSFYGLESDRIVFVNGHFLKEKSKITQSINGVYIGSINNADSSFKEIIKKNYCSTNIQNNNIFTALSSAYSNDGIFIYIPDNVVIEKPLHIVNFVHGDNTKVFSQTRNLIVMGKNSELKLISSYHSLSEDYTLSNIATEIIAGENSSTDFYIFEGEGNSANHINNTFVNQFENSKLKINTSTLCGALVRNEIHVDLLGENCDTNLQGVYFPDKEQHVDNYINIKHSKPNCNSKQLYKGIIDNKAEAVFTGKVFVAKDAQKTDAVQSNKNLLLTNYAKAHSRPQLEIYADDVSCAHGSTTGQLDKEALFYLKTRGIPEKHAKTLLMAAFIGDVINKIELKPYKDYINFLINKRLKGQQIEGLCSLRICPSC